MKNVTVINLSQENKTMEEIANSISDKDVNIVINLRSGTSKTEESSNLSDKPLLSQKERNIVSQEETKMIELNANLKDVTSCLIRMFYQTDKKYSCTQTKLGKMLSILAFRYAINGEKLFNESIYRYPPNCGTLIKALTFIKSRYLC